MSAIYTAAVLTVSDKGNAGEREDLSGPLLRQMLCDAGFAVGAHAIVPDEKEDIAAQLRAWVGEGIALICTTGGTGFSPRDVTPEATAMVCERMVPGIPEAMRAQSLLKTPHAMLSRASAGICERTLIINLPGSPKAAKENLEAVLCALPHGLLMLRGETEHV